MRVFPKIALAALIGLAGLPNADAKGKAGGGYSPPRYTAPKSPPIPGAKAASSSSAKLPAPPKPRASANAANYGGAVKSARSPGFSPPPRSAKAPKQYNGPSDLPKREKFKPGPVAVNGPMKAHDGDTFYSGGVRYRVQGIDTPELGTPRAAEARDRLQQLISNGNVTVQPVARDKYGRTVAKVQVNGEDVSTILKREGLAK